MIPTAEEITTKVESFRSKAANIQRTFQADREAINADTQHVQSWKQEQVRDAKQVQVDRLAETQAQERSYLADAREKLERELFGIETYASDSTVVAYRDAVDRVSKLDWEDRYEAAQLYASAARSSDRTMQTALFEASFRNQWQEVIDAHLSAHPSKQRAFDALQAVDRAENPGIAAGQFSYAVLG